MPIEKVGGRAAGLVSSSAPLTEKMPLAMAMDELEKIAWRPSRNAHGPLARAALTSLISYIADQVELTVNDREVWGSTGHANLPMLGPSRRALASHSH